MVSDLLEKYGDSEAQNDIKSLGGVMYLGKLEEVIVKLSVNSNFAMCDVAAVETVRNALTPGVSYFIDLQSKSQVFIETFVDIMARFPNFAKRAQEEIDAEVGPDRLPTLDDRKNLPYIDCIIREVFR